MATRVRACSAALLIPVYNDKITKEPELQEWVNQGDPHKRMAMPLTPEISKAIDRYLFRHYCQWFGGGTFSKAIAKIPMCNMLDDHDLIGASRLLGDAD